METARNVRARMDENIVLPEREIGRAMGADGDDDMPSDDSVDNMFNLLAPADSSASDSLIESNVNHKNDDQ